MVIAAIKSPAIISRVVASLLGSYCFVWGFITLGIAIGLMLGVAYSEIQMLMFLLAFLVFLGAFLWTFAAASLWRVWLVLAGGGMAMSGAAWFLTQTLN